MVAIEFFTPSGEKILAALQSGTGEASTTLAFLHEALVFSQYCRSWCFGDHPALEM